MAKETLGDIFLYELDDVPEPTDRELESAKVFKPDAKWHIVRCGGSTNNGCGHRFSILKHGFTCPNCKRTV